MTNFIESFKRKETKYLLNSMQREAFRFALRDHTQEDDYTDTLITSIYLDTDSHDMIERSINSPAYKEKIRIRFYTQLTPEMKRKDVSPEYFDTCVDECAFLELKKKYDGTVYKRRVGMSWKAMHAFLFGTMEYLDAVRAYPMSNADAQKKSLSATSIQIAKEIKGAIERNGGRGVRPDFVVSCIRRAYILDKGSEDSMRFTMDDELVYRKVEDDIRKSRDPFLFLIDKNELHNMLWRTEQVPIMSDDYSCVLEIKSQGTYSLMLAKTLSAYKIYKRSFTKVGNAYKKMFCPWNLNKDGV